MRAPRDGMRCRRFRGWSHSLPQRLLTSRLRWSKGIGVQKCCILIRCESLIGNPVRIGSGPAAVNGDEIRGSHCSADAEREGSETRSIRKPEDLPEGEG